MKPATITDTDNRTLRGRLWVILVALRMLMIEAGWLQPEFKSQDDSLH